MTAGLGDQPVADGNGQDRHSLFTKELLQGYGRAGQFRTEWIMSSPSPSWPPSSGSGSRWRS